MARVSTILDEQILDAARSVFLEQGFNTPVINIAKRAGISSGSIFKRFETKEDLLFTAMTCESHWTKELEGLVGQGDLKENLKTISKAILEFAQVMLPRFMLAWSLREYANHSKSHVSRIAQNAEHLSDFLRQERDLGRLRPSLDTGVAAHTIVGAMMSYKMLELMTGKQNEDVDDFIMTFIDTLWKGLVANPDHTLHL